MEVSPWLSLDLHSFSVASLQNTRYPYYQQKMYYQLLNKDKYEPVANCHR